jgi:hypothetical protein
MARNVSLQSHSRRRTIAKIAVFAILVVACGYLVFELGRIQANYSIVDAARERGMFEDRIDDLKAEILSLREQVVLLETHRDIDRAAYKDVEISLTSLQAKIQEQSDAIAFYRGIVSPADGNSGLRVQDLKLSRSNAEHAYIVHLVLVQSLQHDRKVSGDVSLTVEGTEDGMAVSYDFSELLAETSEERWAFSFRYFQGFDREIILPDGFTPERINIEVRSSTRSIASIEESFSWNSRLG